MARSSSKVVVAVLVMVATAGVVAAGPTGEFRKARDIRDCQVGWEQPGCSATRPS